MSTEHIYEIVVKAVAEALNCTHCTFFALEGNLLVPREWYSIQITRRFTLGEGLVGRAAQTRKSILAPNARKHAWFSEGKTQPKVDRSIVVVPVKIDSKVVGVLSADQDQVNAFDERDLEMVETLALQAGNVIKNASLLKKERERADALDLAQKVSTHPSLTFH